MDVARAELGGLGGLVAVNAAAGDKEGHPRGHRTKDPDPESLGPLLESAPIEGVAAGDDDLVTHA